jgi:hypothetical protein
VDGGIVLLQAALELLSWRVFVGERKALSQEGFRRLRADDQLRLLIETCRIPAGVPAGLGELASKAKGMSWTDGPKALAEIRNSLVHPTNQKDLPYYDTWRLAQWYVELALLKMCAFKGDYSNRTNAERWAGKVECVPWARA